MGGGSPGRSQDAWVDGIGFAELTAQPDAVRDRYVEIVYRFFYGTALALGLALGDPHPGNYLLCPDGHVAFFDFGMLRRLPPDYVRREGEISRAVRESEPAAVIAGMHELGYLPGALDDWDGALLLSYMRQISWWLQADEPVRLSPEDLWRSTAQLRDGGAGQQPDRRGLNRPAAPGRRARGPRRRRPPWLGLRWPELSSRLHPAAMPHQVTDGGSARHAHGAISAAAPGGSSRSEVARN